MTDRPIPSTVADDVENVVVLVGDAVRWDHSRDALAERGATYKTVAASLHTPTSFATMLTGRHPVEHGVHGFDRSVPGSITSVFDLDGYDTSFGEGYMNDWLADRQRLVGDVERGPLSAADPPFVWVNRDGGGHAPYGGFDADGQGYRDTSARVYLDRHAGDEDRLQADYARGVDEFVDRVDAVLASLDERGIRDETLVVVASDHGELLGEYGQIGHNFPASPELVYVPTCFIGPGIEPGEVTDDLLRHVDLVPTLASVLGVDAGLTAGVSVTSDEPHPAYGISHYNRSFSDVVELGLENVRWGHRFPTRLVPELRCDLVGCWDRQGGFAVNRAPTRAAMAVLALRLFTTPEGKHVRESGAYRDAVRHVDPSYERYGSPGMDEETARTRIEGYLDAETLAGDRGELDPAAREQLEDLGYV